MSAAIDEADLILDKDHLIEVVACHLNPLSDGRRFDWLYLNAAHGAAKAWISREPSADRICGVAAAFPRRFYSGMDVARAWVLGDFCLDARYRSLGPALRLQRACLSVLESDDAAFCYDFPSASMMAVYKRLGVGTAGQMVRMAKPLRVDRKLKGMIESRVLRGVVSAAGNVLLKWNSPRAVADRSLELSVLDGFCRDEFTALAEENRGEFGICLERSAAYLNWRYVDNPLARHEIVTARRDGRLVGYIVWTQAGEDAAIVDLFGQKDRSVMRCLVAQVTALARERGVQTLSVSMNEGHPWLSLFSEMGFRRRETFPVVIVPSKSFAQKIDSKLTGWYLMQGDRDS